MKKKTWIIIAAAALVAVIGAAGASGGGESQPPQDAAKEKTETTQPEQKEELTLEGETSGSYDEYGMTYTISGIIKNTASVISSSNASISWSKYSWSRTFMISISRRTWSSGSSELPSVCLRRCALL